MFRASTADVVFMLNAIIFGIWHTKHKKRKKKKKKETLLDVLNVSDFYNMLHYPFNFDTVRTEMV